MPDTKYLAAETPIHSVWGQAHLSVDSHPNRKQIARVPSPGRLVAVTGTGPIYETRSELVVVPVSVGLAFTQELAARTMNAKAAVASSLANRVSGDTARSAWARTCGLSSAALIDALPNARLTFLSNVLTYVRRQGNVNGIEPILGAAINAAWPWIDPAALTRILNLSTKYLRESRFAATSVIPVVDPNTRTISVFAPGDLAKIDPSAWLDWKDLRESALTKTGMGGNLIGGDVPNDAAGSLIAGLPGGHSGPDTTGLPGGRPNNSSGNGTGAADLLASLPGGHSGPDTTGLPGRGGDRSYGLIGQFTGRNSDLGNIGPFANGGPGGFGPNLGPAGASGWDAVEKLGSSMQKIGLGVMALGGGLVASGAAVTVSTGGAGAPLGGALAGGGAEIIGWGAAFVVVGFLAEAAG